MKKALSLVIMFLMSMTMMAETVKIDFCQAPNEQSADKVVWQVGNITFTLTKGASSHDANEYVNEYGLKMYEDQVMTISATGGTTISTVTFKDSPAEPTSTAPTFTALQNCTSETGWGQTVMTATADGCTMLGGTLTSGSRSYSHVINANIEVGGSTPSVEPEESLDNGLVGKKFYLYNEESGLFMTSQNEWGVRATLTEGPSLFTLEKTDKGPAYALYNLNVDNYKLASDEERYHNAQRLGFANLDVIPSNFMFDLNSSQYNVYRKNSNGNLEMYDGIWNIDWVNDDFVTVSLVSCYENGVEIPRRYLTATHDKAMNRGLYLKFSETVTEGAFFRVLKESEIKEFMTELAKDKQVSFNYLIQNPDFSRLNHSGRWILNGTEHLSSGDSHITGHSSNGWTYASFVEEEFSLEQEIEDLPEGTYEMTAQAYYRKVNAKDSITVTPTIYVDGQEQSIPELSSEYSKSSDHDIFHDGHEQITPIRFKSKGTHKIGVSLRGATNLKVYFDNFRIVNVFGDDTPGGIDPDPDGWEVTDSTGVVVPTDSIGGGDIIIPGDSIEGGGDIIIPGDSIEGGGDIIIPGDSIDVVIPDSTAVNIEAYRKLYLDFLNYRPKVLKNPSALALYDETEKYCDVTDDHFENQKECDDLYAYLLEKFNIIRRMVGDKPYGEDEVDEPTTADYANLNSAIRRSEWFVDDLADSKYADIKSALEDAISEAKKALDSKNQTEIDNAAQILEKALLKAQNDKKEMDKEPEIAEEDGTPMAPITPDMSKYTHKMMVHGSPWGIAGLNMIMLRDEKGRLVQTMTVQSRNGGTEEVITDSVRTYTYTDTKMIEQLSVPEYDADDNLTLIPMSHKETSYYKLAGGGHREVCIDMREDYGVLTPMHKEVTDFDAQGRKVSYKNYSMWSGEQLEYNYDYTYDEDGGFYTKGKNDWGETVNTYTCYDKNGNQTYKTDYNGLYIYSWDEQNHAQGYKFYRGYDVESNTYSSLDDSHYYIITEKDAEGRTLTMRSPYGTKSYTYDGNKETETVSENGTITTYVRTFDADGRILKMEKNGTALISEFAWSNIDADKVLGGVNTVDENQRWQISKGTTYWTSDKSLLSARRSFTFEGFVEDQTSTYNIVPLSLLPAQTTDEGVAITVGKEGDQVVLSSEGEIYLLDKGGKKRYSVSVGSLTVSSEGGKIIISGWTPISEASPRGMHKAKASQPDQTNLTTEYDIYIPEDVIIVNGEPLNELFLPITLENEEETNGIVELKTDAKANSADGRIYNLQGVEVKNAAKGQILIINGKKVLQVR